jgi:type I restriction enzyme M protein
MINADIEFEKELFSTANKMRGKIAPSEYKHYVLPLIFLRYLSLKYEKRKEEMEQLATVVDSDYYRMTEEDFQNALEDPKEYSKVNVFFIPKEARWNNLLRWAESPDIKNIIDHAMEVLEEKYYVLKGVIPKIYSKSNIPTEVITGLIKTFSMDIFKKHEGRNVDLLGRVYEYFISNFASTEGQRGGEYFTPSSIVKLLVTMLEPNNGIVYDPACGSGGMFIQSDIYCRNSHNLIFMGQEQNELTIKLSRMNGILHGIYPEIKQGDTLLNDCFPDLKADKIISNPPFNMRDWGAEKIADDDPRLIGGVTNNNANYMWIQHFLYHLKDGGDAGFVIANGALTTSLAIEKNIRKHLIDNNYIDCVVQLPEKMFFGTAIPSALIFLSKNRGGTNGFANREGEVLFIDASSKGTLIGKKHKVFSESDNNDISSIYLSYKKENNDDYFMQGISKKVSINSVIENDYKLTPSIYTGIEKIDRENIDFNEELSKYLTILNEQFSKSVILNEKIIFELGELIGEK